jgi:ABC-2 type transport system ATP-binding protein
MIRIHALHKQYRDTARPALAAVDLQVPAGSIFGLLGPNGAGKTTLLSILTGTVQPDRGEVEIDGLPMGGAQRQIGYAPQELAFYPGLSIRENLSLFATLTPGADAESMALAIRTANLAGHLDQRAGALSGGLKRRLNFAIALLGRPRLLCLDEPTAGVDPQSRNFLLETVQSLRAAGVTILYSTHYMEEIERICDHVAILDEGHLIACQPLADLRGRDNERLEAVFLRLTHSRLRESC